VFDALVAWKSDQYLRTGATNVFGFSWTMRLLEKVLAAPGQEFGGILSALYAGDKLVSAHLGLRSHGVMHLWFPAYDPAFGKYSPGLILLLELAKAARSLGVQRLDLGKGDTRFKTSLMTGAVSLAEGSVAVNPLVRGLRRGWHNTRTWVRSSALRGPARLAGRWTRPVRGWLAFR
jgi:CelD/BcsL family acetyltransferase involved in cellulose biosynthesis